MKYDNKENTIIEKVQNDIRVIEIDDPYEFVTGNTEIVYFKINRKNKQSVRQFRLVRTKNGGYMMQ
jgi:hypothetical protein